MKSMIVFSILLGLLIILVFQFFNTTFLFISSLILFVILFLIAKTTKEGTLNSEAFLGGLFLFDFIVLVISFIGVLSNIFHFSILK